MHAKFVKKLQLLIIVGCLANQAVIHNNIHICVIIIAANPCMYMHNVLIHVNQH